MTWPTAYRMSGGGAADGAADQVARVIAGMDLGQAAVHLNVLAAGAGRILRRVAAAVMSATVLLP